MNKIFVTGATGNIGKGIVETLKKNHLDFTCGIQEGKSIEGVETAPINFDNIGQMTEVMEGHDTVFILAPLGDKMKEWSLNILKAAKLAKVKHVVRSSGFGSDPNSDYMLLRVHGEIDKAVMNSGMDYTITRPNTFMQNFASFYGSTIKDMGMIFLPNADARISYSDVRDVSLATANILMKPDAHKGAVYNLLGAPISTEAIASLLSDLLKKEVKYTPVSHKDASKAMLEDGMPEWVVSAIESLNVFGARGGTDTDDSDMGNLMGVPATSFKAFIRDYLDAWK